MNHLHLLYKAPSYLELRQILEKRHQAVLHTLEGSADWKPDHVYQLRAWRAVLDEMDRIVEQAWEDYNETT